MTRKRYIKLLMASGCDRNTAHAMARETIEYGDSYAQAYAEDAKVVALVASGFTDRFLVAAESFVAATTDVVKEMSDMIEAVTRYISQMEQEAFAEMMRNRRA